MILALQPPFMISPPENFIFLLTFTFLGDPTQHRIKDQRQKIICQIADIVQLGASSSRLSSTNTAAVLPPQSGGNIIVILIRWQHYKSS